MRLFIYPNTSAERYIEKLQDVLEILSKNNKCSMDSESSIKIYNDKKHATFSVEESDALVSLGGDGTFLRACQLALKYDKPIFGINCGRLGYLCSFYLNEEIDTKVLEEINIPTLCFQKNNSSYIVINDFVIGKDYFGGTIELGLFINDKNIYNFIGDGIIISTPIGSTGYNSSAGGQVLGIDSEYISITPICPANKEIKPITVKNNSDIKIKLLSKSYTATIYGDGISLGDFKEASIRLSDKKVRMLRREK